MSIRSFRRAHARRIARDRQRLTSAGRRTLVAGATLGASAVLATTAQAATTYTVTSNADTNGSTCGSPCTLRQAINAANLDGGADTINFDSGVTSPILLTNGAMTISDAGGLTISGPGAGSLTIRPSTLTPSRIFDITAPSSTPVTISGLTLDNGSIGDDGGAIHNVSGSGPGGSALSLVNSTISGSTAGDGSGGAIFSQGPLTITGSTITGNTASVSGGGIIERAAGTTKYDVTITDSTITGNTAQSGRGGGVSGGANFIVSGSRITGNQAIGSTNNSYSGHGGGIVAFGGSLSITNTTVSGNMATNGGGGVSADTKYGGTITGSTISGNSSAAGGGLELIQEIYNSNSGNPANNALSVNTSTVSGNQAVDGAGIEITPSGNTPPVNRRASPVTIQASTISGNKGGSSSFGGGILITGTEFDPIELIDSTISGNSATTGAGVSLGDGGIQALLGQSGSSNGSISFDNSTIAANAADTAGGGIYLGQYGTAPTQQSGKASINSTIVAGNSAAGKGQDLFRPTTSTNGGFNVAFSLIQNPGNAPLLSSQSLITGVDPQLGALADNGGPTQTMLPSNTSPAIDQGKAASGLSADQRGKPRTVDNGKPKPPGGDGTDIGAVELALIPPPAPGKSPSIAAAISPATGITDSRAILHGKVTTNGLAVTWHFEYGRTTGYGHQTPSKSISAGGGQVPVSFQVTGLTKGTLYHYRLVGVSSAGQTAVSSDGTFRTLAPSIKVHPGAVLAGRKVRVFGHAGGCTRGDRVTLISNVFSHAHHFAGVPAIFARVGAGDRYSVTTTIPGTRRAGRYSITGRCGGASFGVRASLAVMPAHVKAVRFTG